jgi:hypothetical protein
MFMGLSTLYMSSSHRFGRTGRHEIGKALSRVAAEEGIHLAVAEIKSGTDAGGDGLGIISFTGVDGRSARTLVSDEGGGRFRLQALGAFGQESYAVENTVQIVPISGIGISPVAAIAAACPVDIRGNINIDGRDWSRDGTELVGPGLPGVATSLAENLGSGGIIRVGGDVIDTSRSVTIGGSASLGGGGDVPQAALTPNNVQYGLSLGNLLDDDGDGAVDEEALDGIDNDGDGRIDEDGTGFPLNPDAVVGLPLGSLKQRAQMTGYYFNSTDSYRAWLDARDKKLPSFQIIYLEIDEWTTDAVLSLTMNDQPSILIVHNAAGTAKLVDFKMHFQGLVILDNITYVNGNTVFYGALYVLGSGVRNTLGNGGAVLRFSSEVINALNSMGKKPFIASGAWARTTRNAFE